MSDEQGTHSDPPWSGVVLVLFGCIIAALAIWVASLNEGEDAPEWVLHGLIVVAGILTTVGVVATGVTMGLQRHEWLSRRRPT